MKVKQHTNLEYLETTCGGSTDMINSIISLFIDSTPAILVEMRENIRDKNWDLLKRNAHKIKSSFMMIGAIQIGNKLNEIEQSSHEGNSEKLGSLLESIEIIMDDVIDEIKTI